MSMFEGAYSTSQDSFFVTGAKAGNPTELEAALQAIIASRSAVVDDIADVKLAGVEQGPEWEAELLFALTTGGSVSGALARVAAAVGGTPEEAYANLAARLLEINSTTALSNVVKLEVAGGGRGERFMALALANVSPG